ncbi:ABC transporter ATP-binding protein [Leifsonia sp. ZF2019]|uniref:ABC transporter ATP-binding protein n=1 Tax=Leifsonia sp. ZF2019 TaxID=2781978 RepID=UPI001CBD596F|nr:ABC transporter ATP-binding protein [Leifsonia sp. ZF2019]UAJ80699.1 ABC transporter ATP-binding protein [Leifsonia sp. ZF2019]
MLHDIDLTVEDGEVVGVVGPNGSGKSTLLRSLIGAHRPHAGSVLIDGVDIATASRRWIARRTVFVGQLLESDPALRVSDEVSLGGIAHHGSWRAQSRAFEPRIERALDIVGLHDQAHDPVARLSGGERQRVQIARAIVHGAPHALLDEPTNHLDIRHQLELMALLRRIAPTVVIVLHDLELAARTCDRLVLLSEGEVVASGSPRTVLVPALLDPVYRVRSAVHTDAADRAHLTFRLPEAPAPSDPSLS